jgi:hypothetical protein
VVFFRPFWDLGESLDHEVSRHYLVSQYLGKPWSTPPKSMVTSSASGGARWHPTTRNFQTNTPSNQFGMVHHSTHL